MLSLNHTHPLRSTGAWKSSLAFCLLFVITCTLFTPQPTSARTVYGIIDGLYSFQGGPDRFSSRFDNALGISGGILLDFESEIQILVRLEYHNFPAAESSSISHRGSLRLLMLGSMLRYIFFDDDSVWRPYLAGGYATADLSLAHDRDPAVEIGTEYDTDDLQSVFQIGGGVQIKANDHLWITIEARFASIASSFGSDATSIYPISLGIRF